MDIHKPKAPHSWGELAREVGTIVIGILIALALEEALGSWHNHQTAREARDAVRAEIAANLTALQGRRATEACLARRLDEVADLLARAQDGPLPTQPHWIGQPSVWLMATERWQAAASSGRASEFGQDEQGRYAAVYVGTSGFYQEEVREQAAWAQLRALETWRGPLGSAGRIHFVDALQQARYSLWMTRTIIALSLKAGRDLGIEAKPRALAGLPHSVCVPIDTPRAEAIRQLGDDGFGQPD